jgi:drug/metabolite transporter (DMT)-like permease
MTTTPETTTQTAIAAKYPALVRPRPSHALLPLLALVAVAVTWGVTFSVVDAAVHAMPPADLVAWRFGVATAVLLLVRRSTPPMPTVVLLRAIALGCLLGAGFLLQTWALSDTDAVMSGFLIGTLVVMAPMMGWAVFRVRPSGATWVGAAVATAGLALLSLRDAGFGRGELLTVLAATAWALHLTLLARWGKPEHALRFARIQTATVTAMALLTVGFTGALTGGSVLPAIPANGQTTLGIAFLALPATAAAMVALSWAQSRLSAARAAIILTLEPAAAAVTAAVLGAEFGARTIIGGILLVAAMLVVELGSHRPRNHGLPAGRAMPGHNNFPLSISAQEAQS